MANRVFKNTALKSGSAIKHILRSAGVCAVLLSVCGAGVLAGERLGEQEVRAEERIDLENARVMVSNVIEAYNEGDHERFYKDFSLKRRMTENVFIARWVRGYRERYGRVLEKKLDLEQSRLSGMYPLLVYGAVFEKEPEMIINVNFIEENGEMRIFVMRMDPLYVESEDGTHWIRP